VEIVEEFGMEVGWCVGVGGLRWGGEKRMFPIIP
jgi:hypothetical protein